MADVNKIFPYSKMRIVQINGYDFMEIPKFYIRTSQDSNGLITREVCEVKGEGFRIHPAFVYQNRIYDYLYIESYPSGQRMLGVALTDFDHNLSVVGNAFRALNIDNAVYVNYPMLNIYQYNALLLLMLIENESGNLAPLFQEYNSNWRGYRDYQSESIYGLQLLDRGGSSGTVSFRILDNVGRGIFLQFSFPFVLSGLYNYAVDVRGDFGDGYNFQDLFIANSITNEAANITYLTHLSSGGSGTSNWSSGVILAGSHSIYGFGFCYSYKNWKTYYKIAFLRNEQIE